MTDQTPSPQSVGPLGPKRVLVLKSAEERLILAADMYGVARLDSDDMDDDAVELQDATEGMKDALAAAPAPAPSSLAGGADEVALIVAQACLDYASDTPSKFSERTVALGEITKSAVHRILAALSPEAPAREGVAKACADFQEAIDYFEADVADALAEDSERADLWDREVTVNIDALKTVMLAALIPRHEAPADHHERNLTASNAELIEQALSHPPLEAPAEGAGEAYASARAEIETLLMGETFFSFAEASELATDVMEIVSKHFLRARSSAPEAREEALGNLLAVIHGDGGHRALEVGTKQAALEAEKIVAGLFAAPSADKLRIAVEALEPFANLGVSSGPDDEPCHYAYRITRGAIRNARQALAALKAEGA